MCPNLQERGWAGLHPCAVTETALHFTESCISLLFLLGLGWFPIAPRPKFHTLGFQVTFFHAMDTQKVQGAKPFCLTNKSDIS